MATALRHEVGHALFLRYFIGGARGEQYGGVAPDWLDEAAAVLMETETVTAARRASFAEMVDQGRVEPLATFLTRPHPLFSNPQLTRAVKAASEKLRPGEAAVLKLRDGQLAGGLEEGVRYYAQVRGFVDFLLEASGDDRLLADVGRELGQGGDFEGWLRKSGEGRNLGSTLPELEARFRQWREAKHGPSRGQR
jgi:hypothetical protein